MHRWLRSLVAVLISVIAIAASAPLASGSVSEGAIESGVQANQENVILQPLPVIEQPSAGVVDLVCVEEGLIDINHVPLKELLDAFPFLSRKMAKRVIENRPYYSVDDLAVVPGLNDNRGADLDRIDLMRGNVCATPLAYPIPVPADACLEEDQTDLASAAVDEMIAAGVFAPDEREVAERLVVWRSSHPLPSVSHATIVKGIGRGLIKEWGSHVCVTPPTINFSSPTGENAAFGPVSGAKGGVVVLHDDLTAEEFELVVPSGSIVESFAWAEIRDVADPEGFGPTADFHVYGELAGRVFPVSPADPVTGGDDLFVPMMVHWLAGADNFLDAELHRTEAIGVLPDGRWYTSTDSLSFWSAVGDFFAELDDTILSGRQFVVQSLGQLLGVRHAAPNCANDVTESTLSGGGIVKTAGLPITVSAPHLDPTAPVLYCVEEVDADTGEWRLKFNRSVGATIDFDGSASDINLGLTGNALSDILIWLQEGAAQFGSEVGVPGGVPIEFQLDEAQQTELTLHANVAVTALYLALNEVSALVPNPLYQFIVDHWSECSYAFAGVVPQETGNATYWEVIDMLGAMADCLATIPAAAAEFGAESGATWATKATRVLKFIKYAEYAMIANDQVLLTFQDGPIDARIRQPKPQFDEFGRRVYEQCASSDGLVWTIDIECQDRLTLPPPTSGGGGSGDPEDPDDPTTYYGMRCAAYNTVRDEAGDRIEVDIECSGYGLAIVKWWCVKDGFFGADVEEMLKVFSEQYPEDDGGFAYPLFCLDLPGDGWDIDLFEIETIPQPGSEPFPD